MEKWAAGVSATAGAGLLLLGSLIVVSGDHEPTVSTVAGASGPTSVRAQPAHLDAGRDPGQAAEAIGAVLRRPGALRLSVLCDSVGNDRGEWVNFLATTVAEERPVEVHYYSVNAPGGTYVSSQWNPQVQRFPARRATGRGPVTIWTFGWAGGSPDLTLRHAADVFPQDPDLILYSYGLNLGPATTSPQFENLHQHVRARFPSVPVMGILAHMTHQERPGQATARKILAEWMLSRGVPFVDDRRVLDPWRQGRTRTVFMDPVHPNWVGHVELAKHIGEALHQPDRLVVARREGRAEVVARTPQGQGQRVTVMLRDNLGAVVPYAVAQIVGSTEPPVESSVDGVMTVDVPAPDARLAVSDGITSAVTS